MMTDSPILLVKALYNYKANNNDELCLKKGDVITVTQALDGGWWEGTLNEVTGWFPSNYVAEIKPDSLKEENHEPPQEVPLSPNLNDSKLYRGIVFQDIVDTENNHLAELQFLASHYLKPLKESDILTEVEYAYLVNNLEEVCASSKVLLQMLEDARSVPSSLQRIGGEFLRVSSCIEHIHIIYSSGHPKAAAVIEKHKDVLNKFMEDHGASPPGLLTLTTGLSKPFRRLEKYPALLLELLRHTQENHVDRGDTQRATCLYRDIANACSNIRKQKEMELEILTGNIKDWEGEPIHTLGNIVNMGSVIFLTEDQQKSSQFLVAFPDTLVILSVKMGTFVYEGKLQISGLAVRKLKASDGYQNAFEISGNLIQRITVICPSPETLYQWLSVFRVKTCGSSVGNSHSSSSSSPSSPSHSSQVHRTSPLHSTLPHSYRSLSPEGRPNSSSNRIAAVARQVTKKVWPNWNLRPHPPMRASLNSRSDVKLRRANSYKKEKEYDSEGDLSVRQMLEALNIDRARNTMPSTTCSAPPRLNFDEDKIIINGLDGDYTDVREKTLVDTVYMLKDQIQELKGEVSFLNKSLKEEVQARKNLEAIMKKFLPDHKKNLSSLDC